jgi:Protein of unknown function (DUF4240)
VPEQLSGDFCEDLKAKSIDIWNARAADKTRGQVIDEEDSYIVEAEHWVVDQYLARGWKRPLLTPLANTFSSLSILKKVVEFFLNSGDFADAKLLCKRVVRAYERLYYEGLANFHKNLRAAASHQDPPKEEIEKVRAQWHPVRVIATCEDIVAMAHREYDCDRARVLGGIQCSDSVLERIGTAEERAALAKLKEEVLSGKPRERVIKKDKRKMDEPVFWDLLQETRAGAEDAADHCQRLADRLAGFKAGEISKFNKILYCKIGEAHRHDLWAVAYIIRGGCGDDAFDYFRAWLVLQGKDAFERALANPEAVADLVEKGIDPQAEELLYAPQEAYQDVKGADLPKSAYPKEAKLQGKAWIEEELPVMYPKLCNK